MCVFLLTFDCIPYLLLLEIKLNVLIKYLMRTSLFS
nr:MAG TPA: hypothetical protein [Caudoviricetes sp.]